MISNNDEELEYKAWLNSQEEQKEYAEWWERIHSYDEKE